VHVGEVVGDGTRGFEIQELVDAVALTVPLIPQKRRRAAAEIVGNLVIDGDSLTIGSMPHAQRLGGWCFSRGGLRHF
jgi:hypothetical protein